MYPRGFVFEKHTNMYDQVSPQDVTPRTLLVRAAQALFDDENYDAVHVEDLLRAAGVSRATFYRLFASKQALFLEARSDLPAPRRGALNRIREGAREAFGRHGYDAVRVEHMIAVAGVARSTFYRFFKDKHAAFLELDRTAFQYLRWEIGCSSVDPETRAGHLRFTVESFVEWRSQVGRSSVVAGSFPLPPELPIVAFHTLLDDVDPDAPLPVLDTRLSPTVTDAMLLAVDAIAQQPFEGSAAQRQARRVQEALTLLKPVVRGPHQRGA